jgi:hypothetical protein
LQRIIFNGDTLNITERKEFLSKRNAKPKIEILRTPSNRERKNEEANQAKIAEGIARFNGYRKTRL